MSVQPPVTPSLADRIRGFAEEAVADTDLFVLGVEVRGFQGSRVVEVFVDSSTGAGSDDLTALSRSLGFLLDTEDVVKGTYRLDVSTPGADRPIADPRQYPQHVGRTLAVSVERTARWCSTARRRPSPSMPSATPASSFPGNPFPVTGPRSPT